MLEPSHIRRQSIIGIISICAIIVLASIALSYAPIHPIQPTLFTASRTTPSEVWAVGDNGSGPVHVSGNYTRYATNILLNTVNQLTNASASYTLAFAPATALQGLRLNLTFYLFGVIDFANNSTPLSVVFDGHLFEYHLHSTEVVPWYPTPVYVPTNTDLIRMPSNVSGFSGTGYLPFSYLTDRPSLTQSLTISVPAHGQIYINQLVVVAFLTSYVVNLNTARIVSVLVFPFLAVGTAGVAWLFWRFRVGRFLPEVLTALGIQLAIAPWFLHADLTSLLTYPTLLYNHAALGIGTWGYGPGWLIILDAPFAVPYLTGFVPNAGLSVVLLKLPAIVFGLLTYLLLVRVLEPAIGAPRARRYAIWTWLLNPVVLYFDAVHGLFESIVAFFVLLFVWALQNRKQTGAIWSLCLATLLILPVLFAALGSTVVRVGSTTRRVLLLVTPMLLYLAASGVLFVVSGTPLTKTSAIALLSRASSAGASYGEATTSAMTFSSVIFARVGVYLSPLWGLAIVASFVFLLLAFEIHLPPKETALVAYASLIAFYFTFETLYVQHIIWVLPLFVVLLLLSARNKERAVAIVLGFSILGLLINYGAVWWPIQDPYLAVPLLTTMLLPVAVATYSPRIKRIIDLALLVGWLIGLSSGVFACLVFLTAGSSSSSNAEFILALALVAFFFARILGSRVKHPAELEALVRIGVIGTPILALLDLPGTAPSLIQALYILVVFVSALELLNTLVHWLGSTGLEIRDRLDQRIGGVA